MKARMSLFFLIAALGMLTLIGCGGGAPAPVVNPNSMTSQVPIYMEKLPNDPAFFLASATASSPDPQMAVSKAELDAQGQVATQVAAVIQDKMKTINEDAGRGDAAKFTTKTVDATKRSVNQVMRGLRIREKKYIREGNGYRGFVLVEAPRTLVDEALMGSVAQDEELRTRFMASKIFQEMDARFK